MTAASTGAHSRGSRKGSANDGDGHERDEDYDDGDNNWCVQVLMKPLERGSYSLMLGWVGLTNLTSQQLNLLYGIGFVFTSAICYLLIRVDLGYIFRRLCSVAVPIFSINCAFYWLALYLRKSWSATSIYVLFSACFVGEFFGQYFVVDVARDGFITNPCLACAVLVAASVAGVFSSLETTHSAVMLVIVSFVRFLACTALVDVPVSVRPFVAYMAGMIGVIAAKYMETVFKPPSINNLVAADGKLPAIRRRRSSSAAATHGLTTANRAGRRTSLPALIEKNQSSAAAYEGAIIAEAHGLISDMLADSTLPLHVVSGLHAISSLLKPAETHNAVHKPKVSPLISLTEATSYGSDTEDSPYTGERPSSLPKRLRRSLPQSLIRRMSASTWTTTTSATGMPTLEPEPCRTRSFRHSCDNTPSSSPVASRSNSPSPGSPTTLALNIPKTRSFSVASVGPVVITPRKPSREHRSCFGATADTSRLCPLKTDIAGSLVCARTADMLNELPTGDQASTARDAQSGLSKRLNITSDYESSSSPSSSEHSDHQSCSDDVGGRNVGVIVRSTTDIKSALQKIENIPHQKGDPHKEDRQHKFVHNNTSQSISWSTSSMTSRTGLAHRHSHNDKKVQDTIGHQVASPGDAPEVMLGADPFDIDEVDKIEMLEMRNLAEWDYPIFSLSDVVPSTILSMVAYKIFREVGFFETFRIPLPEFLHYFHALELGYRNNPYHNRVHATDVLHGVYYFTSQAIPGLHQVNLEGDLFHKDCSDSGFDVEKCSHTSMSFVAEDCTCGIMGANFPPLELMALYTAAAMHDYDHPGRTNAFLVATHAPLAVLYNDRSVLESHHAASVWRLFLTHPEYNWLVHLDKAEFKRFRFLVIEAILATDLKQHFEILAEFNAKITEEDAPGIDWTSETDRLMVANMVIKVADINGPCKKKDLHLQWTRRISEEFYEQGDEEASLGLPISPYMDRKHPQLAKLQESFINHLLAPLCNAIAAAGLVPGTWVDGELDSESGSDGDKESDQDCEGEAENDDEDNVVHLPGDSRKQECAAVSKRKVHCHLMQNLKDNYDLWVKVLKQELEEKEREALKLPDDLPPRSLSIDTETGKLEMETIKEEDTPPSSVNTTREDNESSSSSTSPATTDTDHQADHESPVLSINHVTSSDINNRSEMTSLPATKNESEVTSLSDSKSQLESSSPLSASRTVTLNLSRSQLDCHAPSGSQSKSRSRLARPCHKENAVKKSGV